MLKKDPSWNLYSLILIPLKLITLSIIIDHFDFDPFDLITLILITLIFFTLIWPLWFDTLILISLIFSRGCDISPGFFWAHLTLLFDSQLNLTKLSRLIDFKQRWIPQLVDWKIMTTFIFVCHNFSVLLATYNLEPI